MKKTIILLFVLCSWQAQAQYYQHLYGNTAASQSNERNRQHVPSTASGTGYVMVGSSDLASSPTFLSVNVVRTDDNGGIGFAPYFNNVYTFSDPITGVVYPAWATSVAELPNGGTPEYAVIGNILVDPTIGPEVFYLRLDASGNVVLQRRYYLSGYTHRTTKMKTDAAGNTLYITGTCSAAGGGGTQDVFVFSIDAGTTAVNWGNRYDIIETTTGNSLDDMGMDLIENPYTANELLVVGNSTGQGLILRLDASTGSAAGTNPCMRYIIDAAHTNHTFNSIKASANPLVTSSDAFIIGGTGLNSSSVNDVWTVLTDQLGNMGGWSTYHTSASGNNIGCMEVIERLNTSGFYEYYTVGTINQSATDEDVVVLKIDNTGNTVANGEFWYGTSSDIERGRSIVISNTGGFHVSGTYISSAGDEEQLQVNAYFSGETACNYSINTPSSNTAGSLTDHTFNDFGSPSDDNFAVNITSLTDNQICFATSVFGGSNAKSAYTGPVLQFSIRNNGNLEAGNSIVEVIAEQPIQNKVSIKLVDVLGREMKTSYTIHDGKHLSINTGALKQGLYYLSISDGQQQESKTLLVR